MDSRDLLRDKTLIRVLCDTKSLNDSNGIQYKHIEKLLYYKHYPYFQFIRTANDSPNKPLNHIEQISINQFEEDINIEYWDEEGNTKTTDKFHPLEYITQNIEDPIPISDSKLKRVNIFNRIREAKFENEESIFLTTDSEILNNRRRLESDITYSDENLNLMTPEEVAEFAGIFMRRNNDFVYYHSYEEGSSYTTGLTLWCWTLAKLFLHHASGRGYISSMVDRFESLFISIDKVGEQYYSGAHNESDILIRYHFNNGISLLTGITDVLALQARDDYGIDIDDRQTNLRTGDHPLLPQLREHNPDLYNYVHKNHHLIELLHTIRNDIIHRKGLMTRGPGVSIDEQWKSNWNSQYIDLGNLDEDKSDMFGKYYSQFDDSIEEYDPVSNWGIVVIDSDEIEIYEDTLIEPYRFLKKAVYQMVEFADGFLDHLGEENRFEQLDDSGMVHKSDVKRIQNHDLFPLIEWFDI